MSAKESVLSNEALLSQWPHDEDLLQETRKRSGDTILLGFSRGKDSIAAWISLKESGLFKRIVPIHLYLVPDLSFVNDSLKYFEDVFQTKIINIPSPALYHTIARNIFQPPGRLWRNADYMERLTWVTVEKQNEAIKRKMNLPSTAIQANGVRAMDTPLRRMNLHTNGPFTLHNVKIIWNWSTKRVMDTINDHKIKLPVDYEMFGRSFDGWGFQYAYPIKQRFPEDYKKMVKWFPLLELEIMRFTELEDPCRDLIFKNNRWVVNYEKAKEDWRV